MKRNEIFKKADMLYGCGVCYFQSGVYIFRLDIMDQIETVLDPGQKNAETVTADAVKSRVC